MKTNNQNSVIFLCGLKSCGKTSIAKKISELTHCLWLDCDFELLKKHPSFENCKALYNFIGEKTFRDEEVNTFNSIVKIIKNNKKTPVIVSLGGGACDANNILKLAKDNGKLVYLYETEHSLFERMSNEGLPAYLTNSENPRLEFHEIFERRNKVYSSLADYVIQLSNFTKDDVMHNVAKKIIELMQ